MAGELKAPFPWPGGKSKIADEIWARLGNVDSYVEPFLGTAAVMLRRPEWHFANGYRVETGNDACHYVANFWRSVTADPDKVAEYADRPVSEADLHASHRWLVRSAAAKAFRAGMLADPFYHDAKIAGYWVHGLCCWIGSGWCDEGKGLGRDKNQRQALSKIGEGLNNAPESAMPAGRPQLTDAFDIGRGVNSGAGLSAQVPLISGSGDGMDAVAGGEAGLRRPLMNQDGLGYGVIRSQGGTCDARRAWLVVWMRRLADRLRLVRTCYGHWSRVCDSDSTLTRLGLSGVFLDPPYPTNRGDTGKASRASGLYTNDKAQCLDALRDEVLAWCRKWACPQVRVAVCGYEGDGYEALEADGWQSWSWNAGGGYGNQRKGKKGKAANADRERAWFSPDCQRQPDLFAGAV